MLVRYRGINNKGVLERPGTKWMVLRAISSTLKCQFTGKCWKVDFSMPCKTKSREKCCAVFVRSVRSPWTPPDLPNFNLNYEKNSLCEKPDFSKFSNSFFARDGQVVAVALYSSCKNMTFLFIFSISQWGGSKNNHMSFYNSQQ